MFRQQDIRQLKALIIVLCVTLMSGIYFFTQNIDALRDTIKHARCIE